MDLEREKFEFSKQVYNDIRAEKNKMIDLSYLKLTVAILLLIVILYWVSCRFGIGVKEMFSGSWQLNGIRLSDPAHDIKSVPYFQDPPPF